MSLQVLISDRELDALEGQPYMLTILYLYLRRHMDYGTGIVGAKRGISYQSISEALYIEPHQGIKGGSPHRSAIRRAIDSLQRHGLLARIGGADNLIFRCTLAQTDNSARKKPDTIPTPKADTAKPAPDKAKRPQADTGKNAKADIPPVSGNSLLETTTTNPTIPAGSSSDSLIFPKRTHEADRAAMLKTIEGFNPDQQQELLDELTGYIERGKVQSTPTALLHGMAQRCRDGAFVPSYALKVRAAREAVKVVTVAPPINSTPEGRAKGRAMMKQVLRIVENRGTA